MDTQLARLLVPVEHEEEEETAEVFAGPIGPPLGLSPPPQT